MTNFTIKNFERCEQLFIRNLTLRNSFGKSTRADNLLYQYFVAAHPHVS